MTKQFYAPARYQMALPGGAPDVDGGIIFPAGVMAEVLVRRKLEKSYPHLAHRLLDPQLYLATLQAVNCRNACTNLSTYPWFRSAIAAPYESTKQTQAEWRKGLSSDIHQRWLGHVPTNDAEISASIELCVLFQLQIGCEAIILPSPLTFEQGTNYSVEVAWLDKGLAIAKAKAPELPCYPTIAVSDNALRGLDPYQNDLLTVIIDQVTSRSVDGVYIVIEQSNESGFYCSHSNTVGALLRLANEITNGGVKTVIVAPIGYAGLLALYAGATKWTAGWYRTERRIKLTDFDDSDGRAYPTFCTYRAATDVHLDTDMNRLVAAGFLPQIADFTDASDQLMRALAAGQLSGTVADWAYQPANIQAAREHFLRIATRETERVANMSPADAVTEGKNWVQNAAGVAMSIFRHGPFNARTEINHQAAWNSAYDRFAARL